MHVRAGSRSFQEDLEVFRNVLEQVREESGSNIAIQKIPPEKDYADADLAELVSTEDAGIFLRHTMEKVFAQKDKQGKRYLRTAVFDFIRKHESEYTDALVKRYGRIAGPDQ